MSETKEQTTKNCQYCGKECKAKGIQVHQARCDKNPKNQESKEETPKEHIEEPQTEQISEPQKLTVTDLREYPTDDVAWFQVKENDYIYLTIDYLGKINDGTYSVLVRTAQGIFLPPYLIPGFVGLESVNMPPEIKPQEPEPTPDPAIPDIDEEKFEHTVGKVEKEIKKPGFFDMFKKKEVQKPENTKQSGENLADMLKQI